jgi:hypothetical protein
MLPTCPLDGVSGRFGFGSGWIDVPGMVADGVVFIIAKYLGSSAQYESTSFYEYPNFNKAVPFPATRLQALP